MHKISQKLKLKTPKLGTLKITYSYPYLSHSFSFINFSSYQVSVGHLLQRALVCTLVFYMSGSYIPIFLYSEIQLKIRVHYCHNHSLPVLLFSSFASDSSIFPGFSHPFLPEILICYCNLWHALYIHFFIITSLSSLHPLLPLNCFPFVNYVRMGVWVVFSIVTFNSELLYRKIIILYSFFCLWTMRKTK